LHVTNSGTYVFTAHLVSCDINDTVTVFFSPYPEVFAGEDGASPPESELVGSGEFEEAGLVVVVVLRAAASSDVVVIAIISDENVPEDVFA
jgi:hypothetical protein